MQISLILEYLHSYYIHSEVMYKAILSIRLICIIVCILFLSCKNNDYTPKPIAYNRIEKPDYSYKKYEQPLFIFNYSDLSTIEKVPGKDSSSWFNLVYPRYNATIYCSYLPITKETFGKALEDSYHLAYSHAIVANDIKQQVYSNPERHIGGIIYEIEGDVATPVQFFITDSISHFLRGSFYYDKQLNLDSVAPITSFIKEDIVEIFQTIAFRDRK